MALIHWWPFTNDGKDYGLDPIELSPNLVAGGKLGKCHYNSTPQLTAAQLANLQPSHERSISFAMWIKGDSGRSYTIAANAFEMRITPGGTNGFRLGNGGQNTYAAYAASGSVPVDTWTHVAGVWDADKKEVRYYVNGGTPAITGNLGSIAFNNIGNMKVPYQGGWYINDYRIYDHALTQKEVKELSKGLVLHYDFEDEEIEGTTNLSNTSWSAYTSYWTIQSQTSTEMVLVSKGTSHGVVALQNSSIKSQLTAGTTITISGYLYVNDSPYKTSVTYPTSYNSWTNISRESRNDGYFRLTGSFGNLDSVWLFHVALFGTQTADTVCKIKNLQWEIKDHATPFVIGTRSTGIVYDNSGYRNNGTPIDNNVQIVPDTVIGQHSANIVNSYIKMPTPNYPECTIAFWIKRNALTNTRQFIYTGWPGISIELTTGNGWQAYYTKDSSNNTVRIPVNTNLLADVWYHCVFVIGVNGNYSYINGVQTGTSSYVAPYYNSNDFRLGSYSAYANNFNAKIADFKIYVTALSAADVLKEYQSMANLDNSYNLTTRLFVENPTKTDFARLDQRGVFTAKELDESAFATALNFKTYDNGDLVARDFREN